MQMGTLEHYVGNNTEYGQRDALLDDLQLDKVEGSTILDETDTIGRYLAAVFQKGNTPREHNHAKQWPVATSA
jgi:hypothetical protein